MAYRAHRSRMVRFGAISAIGTIAILTLVQLALAENGKGGPSMKSGLLLEARFPRPLSPNENAALKPMDHFKECASCPEMIVVPVGQFWMGSSENEVGSTP